jgi:hypothetical protein
MLVTHRPPWPLPTDTMVRNSSHSPASPASPSLQINLRRLISIHRCGHLLTACPHGAAGWPSPPPPFAPAFIEPAFAGSAGGGGGGGGIIRALDGSVPRIEDYKKAMVRLIRAEVM